MDLRQLRSFVVLAQELHFGRAADLLGISQPALSQQLSQLESDLGARLVDRSSRRVTLTETGEVFLTGTQRTLAEADRAAEAVRDLKSGHQGRLVIGSLSAGVNGPLLPEILRRLRTTMPNVTIELRHFNDSASQERGLLAGSLDIAILRQVAAAQILVTRKLLQEPFFVYVPADHRLADRIEVPLKELADERFVSWPRHLGPSYYDVVTDACHSQGFTPQVDATGDSLDAQLSLVAAGAGVCIQAKSNAYLLRHGVVAVPLLPTDISAPLHLAHRRWHNSVAVAAFLDAIETP